MAPLGMGRLERVIRNWKEPFGIGRLERAAWKWTPGMRRLAARLESARVLRAEGIGPAFQARRGVGLPARRISRVTRFLGGLARAIRQKLKKVIRINFGKFGYFYKLLIPFAAECGIDILNFR